MNLTQLIGIGLRRPHYKEIIAKKPSIGWVEVHSENFFPQGGNILGIIKSISEIYPISLHGIGLSLGSVSEVCKNHLQSILNLIKLTNPKFVSEHLSWGRINGVYIPDLLPTPYTEEAFEVFKKNILITQDFLNREILIENPSSYFEYKSSNQDEAEFLSELCKATGAKILLDINNIFVSSCNHKWDPKKYIDSIDVNLVKEIHVAGHSIHKLSNEEILRVDTHDNYVCKEVWELYSYAIKRFGNIPTLLEWDSEIPPLTTLIDEAFKAQDYFLPQRYEVDNV